MTYYQLLGIPPTSSPDQIRGAYRSAIRRFHPDVNRAPNASQVTAQLNEAWAVLGDPRSRAAYDRSIAQPRPAPPPPPPRWQQPPAWHAPPPSYSEGAYAGQRQTGYAGQRQTGYGSYAYYGRAPYETTVAEPPRYGSPLPRMAFGTFRVVIAVAFMASIVHWFPLILTIGAGIIIARVFSRSFR